MPSRSEIAWAAGLFEGEGCATLTSHGSKSPTLLLAMTDEDVVRRFHAIVGEGSVYVRNRPTGQKTQWQWATCKKAAVQKILNMFLPYMGERRTKRAHEVLANCAARKGRWPK